MPSVNPRFWYGIGGVLLFAIGLAVGHHPGTRQVLGLSADNTISGHRRSYGVNDQLFLVFFADSNCYFCNDPDLPELIDELKDQLAIEAIKREMGFVSMAVALDWSPEEGLAFLRRFGRFDQVAAGYGWANSAAVDIRGMPAISEIPQIVVLRRTLGGVGTGSTGGKIAVEGSTLLARKVGFDEIAAWIDRGTPLPTVLVGDQ